MHIIVFAGASRTGKSTAVHEVAQRFIDAGKSVLLLEETAQPYLDAHAGEKIDRYAMQKTIAEDEKARLIELSKCKENNTYDIALVDRSFADGLVYIYWAILQGEITNGDILSKRNEDLLLSKQLYDEVICFQQMLVQDNNFADYNNPSLDNLFFSTFQEVYKEKCKIYTNKIEFEKELDIFVKKYIE